MLGAISAYISYAQTTSSPWYVYIPKNDKNARYLDKAEAVNRYIEVEREITKLNPNYGRCWRMYYIYGDTSQYVDMVSVGQELKLNCSWPAHPGGSTADSKWGILDTIRCNGDSSDDSACYLGTEPSNEKNAGPCCKVAGNQFEGNPINALTGNKFEANTDFTVPGSPYLSFTRYYNSQRAKAFNSNMGPFWRHSFDYSLNPAGNTFKLSRPDGSVITIGDQNESNEVGYLDYVLDPATGATVGYTYDTNAGIKEHYSKVGQITKIEFTQGGFINFSYTNGRLMSATDHFGRSVQFVYGEYSRVSQVKTPSGATYSYTYTQKGDLTKVKAPDTSNIEYIYDNSMYNKSNFPGALTSKKDETGTTIGLYQYDKRGRAWSSEGAAGTNKVTISYDYTSSTAPANVTYANGTIKAITSSTLMKIPRLTTFALNCGANCTTQGTSATYDEFGNQTSYTDSSGNKTCRSFDIQRQLVVKVVENLPAAASCSDALNSPPTAGIARTTNIIWHSSFRVPVSVVNATQLSNYTYDNNSRVLSVATTGTNGSGTGAEGFGVALSNKTKTVTFTYNNFGQVLTVDGPRTDVSDITTMTYDATGNLTTVTSPLGYVTSFSGYDAEGRATIVTMPNGAVIQKSYDSRGRLLSNNFAGDTTTYTYNSRSLLETVTQPNGQVFTMAYDAAHRLVTVTDQRGTVLTKTWNNVNDELSSTIKSSTGEVVSQVAANYDGLNRVVSATGVTVQNPLSRLITP